MLQYILALLTILAFVYFLFRNPVVDTYVVFVLIALPLINTKILPLAFGFFRTFDVITIIALIFLFKEFLMINGKIQFKCYIILALLFIGFTIISGFNSEFGFATYYGYYPVFSTFIFVRFLFLFFNNGSNYWRVIDTFKIAYVVALSFMTLQILFGHRFVLNADIGLNVFNEDTGIVRYQGIFGDSQFNGQFLALGSFAFLILKPKTSIKIRYLNYGFFSLGVLYILLAGSRSAMGGFIIGLLFLFIFSELRIKIYGIILGVFAILSLYLIAPNNGIFSRADRMGNDLDFRQSIWQEAFEIIKEHPLFGIGLGNFQNYTLKYHQDLYLEISPGELLYFTQPENGYLTILVEQGGIVFAIFCLFFLTPIFNFLNSVFRRSIDLKALYIVAALGSWLTAFNTVYSLSDYRIELTVIMYLFLLIMITSKNNSNHFMNSNL